MSDERRPLPDDDHATAASDASRATDRDGAATGAGQERRPLTVADLPAPRVKRWHWGRLLVWLVPLLALVAVGFYVRRYLADRGPTIVVRVGDATMIQPGETPVRSLGVEIGTVKGVALTPDGTAADLTVQLRDNAAAFAKAGAQFWLVKPDFTGGSISGLGTVLSGPYLESRGGTGDAQPAFVALAEPPPANEGGLMIRLIAPDLRKTDRGTPILYRGVKVGAVDTAMLAEDATHVVLRCRIEARYGPLVRVDSKFWADAPVDIQGGIFSGIEAKVGTLRQLLTGSISFASPADPLGEPAKAEATYVLADEPDKAWKAWSPRIGIDPAQPRPAEPTPDQKRVPMPVR